MAGVGQVRSDPAAKLGKTGEPAHSEEQQSGDSMPRVRLELSWERPATKREAAVNTLIWTGRVLILLSLVVGFFGIPMVWLAVAMLMIYPLYVAIYWRAIIVRRPEVVILVVIAVALAVLFVIAIGLR